MKIQPRQELLAVWKAIGKWAGGDPWGWEGRARRNSISDAELLQCLLLPPSKLGGIRYDHPDSTDPDVRDALSALGSATGIPRRVVSLLAEFHDRYTDSKGIPVFSGGSYFSVSEDPGDSGEDLGSEQLALEVVDSYATSVVLAVNAIEFLRGYRRQEQRQLYLDEIDAVEKAVSKRLTAALVGLQRSFAINVFKSNSTEGKILCQTVSGGADIVPGIAVRLRHELREVRAGLRELGMSPERMADLDENPDLLFECGWSWGVVPGAKPVQTLVLGLLDQPGYAEPAPYLYFTVVTIDSIRVLLEGRTRVLGLLDEDQQQLLRVLNLQWELATRYWATIATFGTGDWPLEELPWRTTDGDENDYYSLMVARLVLDDLVRRRAPDDDLDKLGDVLCDLAGRNRITQRPLRPDPAIELHSPGVKIVLNGSETVADGSPRLAWRLADMATLILGRTLAVTKEVNDSSMRARLIDLIDAAWQHLERRRLTSGPAAGLWDEAAQVFPSLVAQSEDPPAPSWYFTTRAVQCLGTAVELVTSVPSAGVSLRAVASDMLVEAEDRFDEELLRGSTEGGPALRENLRQQQTNLRRARKVLGQRPATAVALLSEALRELDKLTAAREPETGD